MNLAASFHVVTGAARGIGRAVALDLTRRGALGVALLDRDANEVAAAAAQCEALAASLRAGAGPGGQGEAGFRALALGADAGSRESLQGAIRKARDAFDGRLDSVVKRSKVLCETEAEATQSSVSCSPLASSQLVHCSASRFFLKVPPPLLLHRTPK